MQGNGQAVMLMETELAKASDAGDNTWIERFQNLTLDALTESIREENPTLTPSEITAELDKRYNDDAKKILEKWSAFGEVLAGYDEKPRTTPMRSKKRLLHSMSIRPKRK